MSVSENIALEPGIDNKQFWGLDFHNPVFPITASLIVLFIIYALADPARASAQMVAARTWSIDHFDWLFMFVGNAFVLFCIALILLPVGKVRLGGTTARPEYSTMSWFAMLFAAGMGIGLMFWSVAEPVAYYTDWYGTPLNAPARTPEVAMFQMLQNMPMSAVTSALAITLVLVFFVTSADSGALVIDCITAGGKVDAPRCQKVLWACLVGMIAAILLSAGGKDALDALQAGAVTTGLPFTAVLLVMMVGLYKALHRSHYA